MPPWAGTERVVPLVAAVQPKLVIFQALSRTISNVPRLKNGPGTPEEDAEQSSDETPCVLIAPPLGTHYPSKGTRNAAKFCHLPSALYCPSTP